MRRSQTPADGAMPEAKRDEVPLPKAIAHLSIDPKPYPYLPRMLAHDNPVKGSKPVVLLDDVIAYGRQCAQAALESTDAELEALRKDAARLDYLDARNAAKNAKNGTTYGWRLTENHNRIALEDHNWPAIDVRAAIDAALTQGGK